MKKTIALLLLASLLLSCGEVAEEKEEEEVLKTDFFVETISGEQAGDMVLLRKTGQVRSGQDISLSSNASGRVSQVYVKTGDSVVAGQVLAVLADSVGSYGINLQRAEIGVERAKINYESTELSLDKSIFDAQQNLEKLERNLIAQKNDSEQSIILAQDTLNNSQYEDLDSSSSLRLESLDNAIEKSKLDYEIKLSSDQQTIESYKGTLKKEFSGLTTILIDVQEFADGLLGVTDANRRKNDDFEDFLGAQDRNQKRSSELALEVLIAFSDSDDFAATKALVKNPDITQAEMIQAIDFMDEGYDNILDVLNKLEVTLNNSLVSQGSLGDAEIASFTASINGYQSSAQGAYGAYISVSSNMKNFLNTYLDNQSSILKSIELQEKDREIQYKSLTSGELSASAGYERTVIGIQESISNLESQIESAKRALENAKKNKDVTLRSLENAISDAQVSYSSSAKEYGKLTFRSPINGTIGSVMLDAGQEISQGTLGFEIVSDSTPEVEISFSKSEKDLLSADTQVEVSVDGVKYSGTIYAISEVADANLNYKATVTFESGVNIIGNIVNVEIPVYTGKMLLPVNILEIKGDDIAVAKTLSGQTFESVRMRVGKSFGEYIEIVSCAQECSELEIITNDVSNFDSNKFTIRQK